MTRTLLLLGILTIFFTAIAFATPAYSEEKVVEMLNKREDGARMVYSEDITRINVGDTIKWLPTDKGHNVEFIAGPEGYELPKRSKFNKEVSLTFDTPGVYLYQCTPHKGMGMIALVVVGDDTSNADQVATAKVFGGSKKKLKKLIEEIQ
jgi:pseudoazurin